MSSSTVLLLAFASAFFSRLMDSVGLPSAINFLHFLTVPLALIVCLSQSKATSRNQAQTVRALLVGLWLLMTVILTSALLNGVGMINAVLSFLLLGEPFILLAAFVSVSMSAKNLKRLEKWILGFVVGNLLLAYIQWPLLLAGIISRGGMGITDAIQGVFYLSGAGNYVSVSVSLLFGLYFFAQKERPFLIRYGLLIGAAGQLIISDSKQILIASMIAWVLLALISLKDPAKAIRYLLAIVVISFAFVWGVQNLDALSAYNSWARPHLYGPDGEFTKLKLAAFNLVPPYYSSPLNWLFGLGPGQTVGRLGGWMLKKYWPLLEPLGATRHPVSEEAWAYWTDTGLDSTFFSPLFGWSGIWGDLGLLGLAVFLYLGYVVWSRLCKNTLSQFSVLKILILGFVFTQMEEPGFMLSVSVLIGLLWHQKRLKRTNNIAYTLVPMPQEKA